MVARYLFNAGEGAQRLCAEFRVKSSPVRGILLSRLDGLHAGGVAGLTFALSDAGSPALALRGPCGLARLARAFGAFIPRRWPEVSAVEVERQSNHMAKFERLGLVQVLSITTRASSPGLGPAPCSLPTYCHWCSVDRAKRDDDDASSTGDAGRGDSSGDDDSSSSSTDSEGERREGSGDDGAATADEAQAASARGGGPAPAAAAGVGVGVATSGAPAKAAPSEAAAPSSPPRAVSPTPALRPGAGGPGPPRGPAEESDSSHASLGPTPASAPGQAPAPAPAPAPGGKTCISYIVRCWSKVAYNGTSPLESGPALLLAVVDCPSLSYLPSLAGSVHMRPRGSHEACHHRLDVVFHLAGGDVVDTLEYRRWMATLAPARHVLVHHSAGGGSASADPFASSARWASCLRLASPRLFPPTKVEAATAAAVAAAVADSAAAAAARAGPEDDGAFATAAAAENTAGAALSKVAAWPDGRVLVPAGGILAVRDGLLGLIEFPLLHGAAAHAVVADRAPLATSCARQQQQLEQALRRSARVAGFAPPTEDKDANELDVDGDQGRDRGGISSSAAATAVAATISHKRARHDEALDVSELEHPALTFLGTGAAKPAKLRGCSAILVDMGSGGAGAGVSGTALLDCGEGTLGQLIRLRGSARARADLSSLRWVWISHHHLDHHGGLGPLVEARAALRLRSSRPLIVIGPPSLRAYLDDHLGAVGMDEAEAAAQVRFVPCHDVGYVVPGARSCPVAHCRDAYAIALPVALLSGATVPAAVSEENYELLVRQQQQFFQLRHQQQSAQVPHAYVQVAPPPPPPPPRPFAWLVYSGDTRPCPPMWHALSAPPAQVGCVYSVLVHEATFDDSMAEQAAKKRHSTVGEAMQAGRVMRADLVLLTHFSQRYPRLAVSGAAQRAPRFAVASDLMALTLLPDREATLAQTDSLECALSKLTAATLDDLDLDDNHDAGDMHGLYGQ